MFFPKQCGHTRGSYLAATPLDLTQTVWGLLPGEFGVLLVTWTWSFRRLAEFLRTARAHLRPAIVGFRRPSRCQNLRLVPNGFRHLTWRDSVTSLKEGSRRDWVQPTKGFKGIIMN